MESAERRFNASVVRAPFSGLRSPLSDSLQSESASLTFNKAERILPAHR